MSHEGTTPKIPNNFSKNAGVFSYIKAVVYLCVLDGVLYHRYCERSRKGFRLQLIYTVGKLYSLRVELRLSMLTGPLKT